MLKKSEKFRRFVTASQHQPGRIFRFKKALWIGEGQKTYWFLCGCSLTGTQFSITAQRRNVDVYTYVCPTSEIPAEDTKARKRYLHQLWMGIERKVIAHHQDE